MASALAVAEAAPSPEGYRAVSREYYRLGISDRALAYLERALVLDVRDGATYDALARIWRDGGVPDRALADGYRAVYFAPLSAAAHNTLGTVFQALGRSSDARREYQRAIDLDASAAYALNNLCYAWMLEREAAKAEAACRQALTVDPSFRAARNNLALAYAASGKMDAARVTFDAADDKAEAQYNIGIVQLARRRYGDAVSAFAAAQQLRPEWRQATVRARQAEQLARAGAEE